MEPFGFEAGSALRADLVRPPQGGRTNSKGDRKPGRMLGGIHFQVPGLGLRVSGSGVQVRVQIQGLIPAPVPAPVPEPVAET